MNDVRQIMWKNHICIAIEIQIQKRAYLHYFQVNKQSTAQVNQVLRIGILQFLSNWANPKNLGTILIAWVLED